MRGRRSEASVRGRRSEASRAADEPGLRGHLTREAVVESGDGGRLRGRRAPLLAPRLGALGCHGTTETLRGHGPAVAVLVAGLVAARLVEPRQRLLLAEARWAEALLLLLRRLAEARRGTESSAAVVGAKALPPTAARERGCEVGQAPETCGRCRGALCCS